MKRNSFLAGCLVTVLCSAGTQVAHAQSTPASRVLDLAPDSPFRDPDIIYLEADELISNDAENTLIAVGEVEGRYQDRTLRADQVTYYMEEGRVIATGNVTLVNGDGSSQFAERIELSNELSSGAAYNFTARLPNGGITGAAYAQRREDGIDLYNAYYTACEPCQEDEKKNPSWQIKAKRVTQNSENNMILYKDAVFELFGLPVLYTPYLAHPDPSRERASGWLAPFGGYSSSRGAFIETPYYLQLDDYSELTLTPQIFTKVNPLLGADYRRRFYSGDLNINASATYSSWFDRDGNPFTQDEFTAVTEDLPLERQLRGHVFADGEFGFGKTWDLGFTAQWTSDDLYTRRYNIQLPGRAGLYDGDSRRLISQVFGLGQSDNFRLSASAYGFQSLRTNINENANSGLFQIGGEDDDTLPIVAPKLEASYHIDDPLVGGRLELFGDFTSLTRDIGHDYTRGTAGASYNKTFVLPGGIEAKPFGELRYDNFALTPYDFVNDTDLNDVDFERTIGQAGLEVRWPFLKSTGDVDIIVEPRAMITESFGDGRNEQLRPDLDGDGIADLDFLQDSIDIDFDHNLIWDSNKSTGFDIWQEGLRADVGGSVTALWGDNYTSLFLGQSFTDDVSDVFDLESGLASNEPLGSADKSDMVGQFELAFSNKLIFDTRFRFDDDDSEFRRLDTGFRFNSDFLDARLRYYKIDQAIPGAPAEEINGTIGVNVTDNWRLSYSASRDLDRSVTRRQVFGIGYQDHCTRIDLFYSKFDFSGDLSRDTDSFGIRISLLSLGQFGGDDRGDRF